MHFVHNRFGQRHRVCDRSPSGLEGSGLARDPQEVFRTELPPVAKDDLHGSYQTSPGQRPHSTGQGVVQSFAAEGRKTIQTGGWKEEVDIFYGVYMNPHKSSRILSTIHEMNPYE